MIDHVDELLRHWRSSTFVWGSTDCMLSIGDYIASRGGVDVASRFRSTYDDEAGALAHMAACGGAVGLIDLTGLPRTATPLRGDVVAIGIGHGVGGVCTGPGVAVRRERGAAEIDIRRVQILAAWSLR